MIEANRRYAASAGMTMDETVFGYTSVYGNTESSTKARVHATGPLALPIRD